MEYQSLIKEWTQYIENHIDEDLTTKVLASSLHYSATHIKRVFREAYHLSLSDYIRKRRLELVSQKMREGMHYMKAASMYGFKTKNGFTKAFRKEFGISPVVYSKGVFKDIDAREYGKQYKDILKLSIVELKSIQMCGKVVAEAKDISAEKLAMIAYWREKEFPSQVTNRRVCNVERVEDKIALWYPDEDLSQRQYILGDVVKRQTEEAPAEMQVVTLNAGKYAIFHTDKPSDEEKFIETLQELNYCVFSGWIRENRSRIDRNRIPFQRFVHRKIYLYVPVND